MGAIYDLTELRKMSGNDEEFVQEMLVTFLSNNQEYLVLLNDACENKDWKTLYNRNQYNSWLIRTEHYS